MAQHWTPRILHFLPYTPQGFRRVVCFVVTTILVLAGPSWTHGQPIRKATTLPALLTYPVFFHGERIVVRARALTDNKIMWLTDGEVTILALGNLNPKIGEQFEALGTFWDVGRLEPGDSRFSQFNLFELSTTLLNKPWPGTNELPILVIESTLLPTQSREPTVRTIALKPETYEGKQVTITGRFKGRNLYGDLPEAPGISQWDFVLQSADGAVWVTELEPRGEDFHLDVTARVDTGRWLAVTGVVHRTRALVGIKATELSLVEPPAITERRSGPEAEPLLGPAPEIIFSVPTHEDVDVPRDTLVRLQFSRDMDPDSFKDAVRISYSQNDLSEQPEQPRAVDFNVNYLKLNRVLEIHFLESLDPFRNIVVELFESIIATDGVSLEPWMLTFTSGS